MENGILWLIGSNVPTFVFAWTICRVVTRHQMLEEQAQREQEIAKTQAWVKYLETLQGGKHE